MPHDGGCGRLTERFPSRGRRASTAFARKPVVSSARPARRDAGATKTRHRRRRRFSRRDGPASRARRERERATYLDGAERRGGGKGEGGHLRGLYVNGAFVVCRAPPPTSVSTRFRDAHIRSFRLSRASSSIDSRATTSDRRSNPRVKMWGVFPPTREKPCPCHTRQHRLSKRHFRENNNANAVLIRICLGCFRKPRSSTAALHQASRHTQLDARSEHQTRVAMGVCLSKRSKSSPRVDAGGGSAASRPESLRVGVVESAPDAKPLASSLEPSVLVKVWRRTTTSPLAKTNESSRGARSTRTTPWR